MTADSSYDADWWERAACAGEDTARWFSPNSAQALKICARCQVRPECLYDALQHEPPHHHYGVRGGLTAAQRDVIPPLPRSKAVAISALREVLAALDDADHTPDERTDPPVNTTPSAHPAAAPASDTELVTISKLLRWAEEHPDPAVQDQAARAEVILTGLRRRYAADQELAAITSEAGRLEKRLAELRAREAELVPAKPKAKRKPVGYPAAEVRTWAQANGIACPPVGRVPGAVVDAWRAAQQSTEATSADA